MKQLHEIYSSGNKSQSLSLAINMGTVNAIPEFIFYSRQNSEERRGSGQSPQLLIHIPILQPTPAHF
jgi:hypothetical protein